MSLRNNIAELQNKRNKAYYLFLIPAIALFLLINIYPLIYSLVMSTTDMSLARPFSKVNFVGFDNYIKAFTESAFLLSFLRTVVFVALSLVVEFILGLAISLLLYREGLFGKRLLVFFLIPMMLTPIIVGLLWRFMYNFNMGLINNILESFGIGRFAFLGLPGTALLSIVVTDAWQWTPYIILFLYSGLQSMPVEYTEAAMIDGARAHQMLWHITLPFLRNTIFITMIIRGMDAIREYDKIYTMTHGGPGTSTETVSYYIYRQGFQLFDTAYACATSLLLLLVTLFLTQTVVKKLMKRGQ